MYFVFQHDESSQPVEVRIQHFFALAFKYKHKVQIYYVAMLMMLVLLLFYLEWK